LLLELLNHRDIRVLIIVVAPIVEELEFILIEFFQHP